MMDGYSCVRSRSSDTGILAIPLAGPPGTGVKLVRVHAGIETENVSFSADRIGGYPQIPSPTIQDPNVIFLGGTQSAPAPMVQPQGPHRWILTGNYVYVHRQQVGLDSPIPVPQMPFDSTLTALTNTIPVDAFNQQIIGGFQGKPLPAPIPKT